MKIKWYWLAEQMGLVSDLTAQYNDGAIHYRVSAQADEVFAALFLSLIPFLFLFSLVSCFLLCRMGRSDQGRYFSNIPAILLCVYGVLLSFGAAPYLQFYPQSSGFLSLDTLENIIRGLYCSLLAFSLFLGGKTGRFLAFHCTKRTESLQ